MQILNIDDIIATYESKSPTTADNHEFYPQHDKQGAFRWLVIGPSGSGKTNLILDAIIQNKIQFDHIYLYARDPTQPKYQFLMKWVNELEDTYKKDKGEAVSMMTVETDPEKIVDVDDLNSDLINLVIIDDMVLEKDQSKLVEYFVRGRHRSANCMYLTQSYFDTPKTIRLNCDYFSIFGLPSQNELIQLTKEHSMGMDNKLFKKLFHTATEDKHNFFHIDRKTENPAMRFRMNMDQGYDGALTS